MFELQEVEIIAKKDVEIGNKKQKSITVALILPLRILEK